MIIDNNGMDFAKHTDETGILNCENKEGNPF